MVKCFSFKSVVLFLFISGLLLLSPRLQTVRAAETFNGFRFVCMDQYYCDDQENRPENGGKCWGEGYYTHRMHLESNVSFEVSDDEIYITECVEVPVQEDSTVEYCTTGDPNLDSQLFCTPEDPGCEAGRGLYNLQNAHHYNGNPIGYNITNVNGNDDYGVHYLQNGNHVEKTPPILVATNANGNLINPVTGERLVIEWQSFTNQGMIRRYLAWDRVTISPDELEGGIGGQQQDDLNFAILSASCEGEGWDPYGYVFDARTLLPVDESNVFIAELNPSGVFDRGYASSQNPLISNPYISAANGFFSFFVEDGDYKLQIEDPQYRTLLPSESTLISVGYDQIYDDIYFADDTIQQRNGQQEHRDIPVYSETPQQPSPLVIMREFTKPNRNGTLTYSGQVSHPFAKLTVDVCEEINNVENCNLYETFTRTNGGPDKRGEFEVILDQRDLEPGQYFRMLFETTDLIAQNNNNLVSRAVHYIASLFAPGEVSAQTRSALAVVEPIPSYLEGYAYDQSGLLIPNALVSIHVDFTNAPIYQKRADAQGHFKITSEFIPQTPYTLAFTGSNGQQSQQKTKLTTAQFLAQNKGFIDVENVNPYVFTTANSDPRRAVTPTYVPDPQISIDPNIVAQNKPSLSPKPEQQTPTETVSQPNSIFLVAAIVLLLAGVVGGLLAIYIYRKRMIEE
ncbi:hypothetical protein KC726_03215 [Candidatus Woesebacteria bacterium]|nr:hypothetical protein [Candidatus Woesebacteria bacterium]